MSAPILRAYLAAPYVARERVRDYAEDLMRLGIDVVASWLDEAHEINAGSIGAATALDPAEVARHAATDLDDIERCDVLVLFTGNFLERLGFDRDQLHTGGRHVETGYALAKGVPVIVLGEPENVFHRLDHALGFPRWVHQADNWAEALGELKQRLDAARAWSA